MLRSPVSLRLVILVLTFGCLNGVGVVAQDGPPSIPCIDMVVLNARTVVVGRIAEVLPDREGPRTVAIAVEQRLRGAVGSRVEARIRTSEDILQDWKAQGTRLLVATERSDRPAAESTADLIDLEARNLKVIRADMTVLVDAGSIVFAAEEVIREHPGVYKREAFTRTIPAAVARTVRPDDCRCTLDKNWMLNCLVTRVPVDEALERWAFDAILSEQVWERAEGASALRHFPSDANIALLKTLLEDPGVSQFSDGPVYSVRQYAYESLSSLGVRVPKPAMRP